MKKTFTITSETYDEDNNIMIAMHAQDYYHCLESIMTIIRQKTKYLPPNDTTWEEVRQVFVEQLKEYRIDI